MILARSRDEVEAARRLVGRIGKLTDNLIGVGPFGIGIEGVLTWIPGAGELYGVGAGAALLGAGVRARVPLTSLAAVLIIVLARSGAGIVPLAGQIAVDLFRGHKWAADILTRAIDQTAYVEGPDDPASPAYAEAMARLAAGEKRRVVFLG